MAKRSDKVLGDERPPVEECVQIWPSDWMVAQVMSARRFRKNRRVNKKGVSLSYEGSATLKRRAGVLTSAPAIVVLLLLFLVYAGIKGHWLSGGRQGVLSGMDEALTLREEREGSSGSGVVGGLLGGGLLKGNEPGPLGIMPTMEPGYELIPTSTPGSWLSGGD